MSPEGQAPRKQASGRRSDKLDERVTSYKGSRKVVETRIAYMITVVHLTHKNSNFAILPTEDID